MNAPTVPAGELAGLLASSELVLDGNGVPRTPILAVDLDADADADDMALAARGAVASNVLLVGVSRGPVPADRDELVRALTWTLVPEVARTRHEVAVPDVDAALAVVLDAVAAHPRAALTLGGLLRVTSTTSVAEGLVAESLAYSMLLAGPEFAGWRATRTRREQLAPTGPVVLVDRDESTLRIVLNRPDRHNAFSRPLRDGLVDAFDLANLDSSIRRIEVSGNGPSFCSGGDLDEFGTSTDVTTAHLIRLDRSVAARLHERAADVQVSLHGACIGAGIEISSYAGHLVAAPGTFIQLPEVAMGLVPGAGGTVGITRRIGRWRTAHLAVTGERIDLDRALEWGLVDARAAE